MPLAMTAIANDDDGDLDAELPPSVMNDPGASQLAEERYREVDEFILDEIAKYATHHRRLSFELEPNSQALCKSTISCSVRLCCKRHTSAAR